MNTAPNHNGLWRAQAAVRAYLHPRRHTALLVAIIAAFMVRPLIGDSKGNLIMISIALIVLMLVALYTVEIDELVGERACLRLLAARAVLGRPLHPDLRARPPGLQLRIGALADLGPRLQ
jgi:hypothetical protein